MREYIDNKKNPCRENRQFWAAFPWQKHRIQIPGQSTPPCNYPALTMTNSQRNSSPNWPVERSKFFPACFPPASRPVERLKLVLAVCPAVAPAMRSAMRPACVLQCVFSTKFMSKNSWKTPTPNSRLHNTTLARSHGGSLSSSIIPTWLSSIILGIALFRYRWQLCYIVRTKILFLSEVLLLALGLRLSIWFPVPTQRVEFRLDHYYF